MQYNINSGAVPLWTPALSVGYMRRNHSKSFNLSSQHCNLIVGGCRINTKARLLSSMIAAAVKILKVNRQLMILIAALILVFVVPYSLPERNFNYQCYPLLIVGLISWLCLLTLDRNQIQKLKNVSLLVILVCPMSLIVFSNSSLNTFGNYFNPIGSLTLIAFVGIAVMVSKVSSKKVLTSIFVTSTLVAIVSIVHQIVNASQPLYPGRLSGIMFQPDILGAYLGVGLIAGIGVFLSQKNKTLRFLILGAEGILFTVVWLTKTRSIYIGLFVVALILCLLIRKSARSLILALIVLVIAATAITAIAGPKKIESIVAYRTEIQRSALAQFIKEPFSVSGNNGLDNDLACVNLSRYPALVETCDKDYIFTSTHNIFLDRVIELGIFGGVAYIALMTAGIVRKLSSNNREKNILGLMLILISIYYLTNVTSITLELLVWLILLDEPKTKHPTLY